MCIGVLFQSGKLAKVRPTTQTEIGPHQHRISRAITIIVTLIITLAPSTTQILANWSLANIQHACLPGLVYGVSVCMCVCVCSRVADR